MSFAKLIPIASGRSLSSSRREEVKIVKNHPIALSIDVESPPCVLYGSPTDSTGALLGGLLTLVVKEPKSGSDSRSSTGGSDKSDGKKAKRRSGFNKLSLPKGNSSSAAQEAGKAYGKNSQSKFDFLRIDWVKLSLVQKMHYGKPFVQGSQTVQTCKDCTNKLTVLKKWKIQETKTDLVIGEHAFPFSYLIPGNLPATSTLGSNPNCKLKYELIATASYADPASKMTSSSTKLQLVMPIMLTRSIARGPDRNSLRVFPPTNLTASAVLPNVVYPKSMVPLEMKLDGISGSNTRWRMRKLSWRIEETVRIRTNACKLHVEEIYKLETDVKQKELNKIKKPVNPIKRYGDLAPQVRVAVAKINNAPLPVEHLSLSSSRGSVNDIGNADDDEEADTAESFIHPSDDALRQQVLQERQRVREEQIQEEMSNETTLVTEEVRIIADGVLKSGWKTDFSNNGKVEIITDIDCSTLNSGVSNPVTNMSTALSNNAPKTSSVNVSCDVQDHALGINVSHILSVEIVVAEEALQYSNGQPVNKGGTSVLETSSSNPDQRLAELSPMLANRNSAKRKPFSSESLSRVTSIGNSKSNSDNKSNATSSKIVGVPTGGARVLRCQFRLPITERSGLGISWDDEVPPIYQDVSFVSPPSYDKLVESLGKLTHLDTEELYHSDSSNDLGEEKVLFSELLIENPVHIFNQSTTSDGLASVLSPSLNTVISINGSVPNFNNPLTPRATRDIRIRNASEILDTDRFTQ